MQIFKLIVVRNINFTPCKQDRDFFAKLFQQKFVFQGKVCFISSEEEITREYKLKTANAYFLTLLL